MTGKPPSAPRSAALVGPYLSGKTSLLESLLMATDAIHRKGAAKEGTTIGDATAEARARQMSVEMNVASATYLGDAWTFIDCPGSIEFSQETLSALAVVDAAIVVCEPVVERALTLAPLFRYLDDHKIPHMVFINKMDTATASVRAVLEALQSVSDRPLLLREIPIRDGERITGYVDLVSERAFKIQAGKASDLIQMPETVLDREKEARSGLLETLSDFDDKLLEELLEDTVPSADEIYANLTRDLHEDLIVPVFFGSAEGDFGVRRLLKALRHEAPEPQETALRLGIDLPTNGEVVAQVFKTYNLPHTGKLSMARVWRGSLTEGASLNGTRVASVVRLLGQTQNRATEAGIGDIVGLGRMDNIATGDVVTASGQRPAGFPAAEPPLPPVFAVTITAEKRSDEVKLTAAIGKLTEEDPSLSLEMNADTHELLMWGQGEIHLQNAVDKLKSRYNMAVTAARPQVPYKESIRKGVSQHGRHKRQTGGHGQFGDVHIDIAPLPRGTGFTFTDKVVGGSVPRQFIGSVEDGVREYLPRGPLGFPVMDVAVTLTDGSSHAVDSSDAAFKTAARIAMSEGMPKCDPVLLEPICQVEISVPNEFTSRIQRLISGRRGQILGYDARQGWKGWDTVSGFLPQSEMHDLIIELRSATLGVGSFSWKFDHLQELSGRLADKVVEDRKAALDQ